MNNQDGPFRRVDNSGAARRRGQQVQPRRGRAPSRIGWAIAVVVLIILILPNVISGMVTDWMWFNSQGLDVVYTTRLWLALGVFVGAGLIAGLFSLANWAFAWRAVQPRPVYAGQREPLPRALTRGATLAASIAVGVVMGLAAAGEWPTILLYLNSVPFGQSDPLFNNDIGFYVFTLPVLRFASGWAIGLLVLTAIGVALIFLAASGVSQLIREPGAVPPGSGNFSFRIDGRTGGHLSVLGALFLLLVAGGYWLGRYDLLFSTRSVGYGAGYADVNARLPALNILMVVAAAAGLLLVANIWVRAWKLLAAAFGVWLLAMVLAGWAYPALVQQFVVKPSELERETGYIEYNIKATRAAYGLDKFREREVPSVGSFTSAQLTESRSIVNDIRLWDYRPLLDTFSQLQEIRSYYSFGEVDIDRYRIDGATRQVMLSARELSTGELADQVRTWQNQHLVYTHGYGAVASSVNEIEGEGLPRLLLKNVPPETTTPALSITRPELYYGEMTNDYVFVNSGTPEFDYPLGDANKFTTYAGKGGVALSDFFTKLLFAARFGDGNVLLSSYITPQTRVLFHRNIHDSVRLLAPFLMYDHDPYLVIADGKLYWLQDAYTTSDRYPYSAPYADSFNYIRNSVKVAISAYDGTTTFYVADPTDPIVRAYRGIFPSLFKDISTMPAALRSHVRYPEDLLNVQASMYATYHMTVPQVFYTKEDVWTVPLGTHSEDAEPLEAYYTVMRLPGERAESFMLILPFTPRTKDNMIAWMAANSDGEKYGQVDVIRYPKQQLVYGPKQIEARIDQDPTISQQLTLWNQSGSKVRRGNLLTVPISNSVLYVEPLFLQATSSRFPELKRVIAATGDRVGIGADLSSALNVALNLSAPPPPTAGDSGGPRPTPLPGQTPLPTSLPGARSPAEVTQSALGHYDRAQDALKRTDWATYGREIDAMKADLDELARLNGASLPSPSASPGTPTPTASP